MSDNTLRLAFEQFILQRINACGAVEPDPLAKACERFFSVLYSLGGENDEIVSAIENAYLLLEGELKDAYYRAGFRDACRLREIIAAQKNDEV